MEKTALRNLLTSVCANSPWKYAVFWKLKHMCQMLLTWEDGYCDYTKKKKSFEDRSDPHRSSENSKILSFGHQSIVSERSSMDFSIGFAIGYMSCLQYTIGEGVIGRVALTGGDNWIFLQNSGSGEFCSPKPEFPEEWNLQVTAGIETILLVPLLPHGVLQLGSFDKVAENLSLVSEVRDQFNSFLYKSNLVHSTLPDNVLCPSSMRPIPLTNREETNSWCTKLPSEMQFEDSEAISTDKVVHRHLSIYSEPMPETISNNQAIVPEHSGESDLSNSSFDPVNLSNLVGQHANTDVQETICDLLASYMDDIDEAIHCSLLYGANDVDVGISRDTSDGVANVDLHEDVLEESLTVSDDITTCSTAAGTFFGFPVDCELVRGIETYFPEEHNQIAWDFCGPSYYNCSNDDLISSFDPSPWEYAGFFNEDNHEDPMQGVVPNIYEQSDDVNSCTILSSMSSIASMVKNTTSSPAFFSEDPLQDAVPNVFESSDDVNSCTMLSSVSCITSLVKNIASSPSLSLPEEAAQEPIPPTHGSRSLFTGADFCHSINLTPSPKSGMSMLTEEKKRKKLTSGEVVKQTAISKKARTNDGHKSRPRDRQLIQERLKELRDLVPNGEKGSIDSLLDKAIKHMQFLTNVTEQAEKLKHAVDKEILAGEKLNEEISQQKGANSGIEDLKLYPVTVKDLPHPGSMLIEMACNEEELFFEITKVLSRLGLPILKSVMETNSGSTSAQFIVEAPKGFSKMEIFFPLMQLLQRRRNTMTPVVV